VGREQARPADRDSVLSRIKILRACIVACLVEHATALSQLRGKNATIYAAFYRIADCDGAPARVLALVDPSG